MALSDPSRMPTGHMNIDIPHHPARPGPARPACRKNTARPRKYAEISLKTPGIHRKPVGPPPIQRTHKEEKRDIFETIDELTKPEE